MIGMLSVLAEFERDIIRERTMAGLKAEAESSISDVSLSKNVRERS
ncbi:recombinase family protein [Rossellomorea vietnamensis]